MAYSDPGRTGPSLDVKPHAYDPVRSPELFEGVLPRRIIAFCIDTMIILVPVVVAVIFMLAVTIVTFGLGAILFWLLWPGTVIWALYYYGSTLGGRSSATIGMRVMELEMRTWYGAPCYFVLGAVHPVLFWLSMSATPLILLVAFFNDRHRLLHDIVLGTVVINAPARANALAGRPRP